MNGTDLRVAAGELEGCPLALDPNRVKAVTAGAWQTGPLKSAGTHGSVHIVPVFGYIAPRESFAMRIFGGVPLDRFTATIRALESSESVSAIILLLDSPGGSVHGVEEAFQAVYKARANKRIISVVDPLACSAAYYIASAADEVVITPSGEVGSIGVYTIHFDWSGSLANEGVKPTIVRAGKHKAETTPYEPLEKGARQHLQTIVDDYYNQFVRAVAKGRAVGVKAVLDGFGQGRTLTAKRAVDAGMADRIGTLDDILEELRPGGKSPPRASAPTSPWGGRPWQEVVSLCDDNARRDLRRVCRHEAGHAVLMMGPGGPGVSEVLLKAEIEDGRVSFNGQVTPLHPSRMTAPMYAGGIAAVMLWAADPMVATSGTDKDCGQIEEAQRAAGIAVNTGSAVRVAKYVLSQQWYALKAVSDALEIRGRLSGDEIQVLLGAEAAA